MWPDEQCAAGDLLIASRLPTFEARALLAHQLGVKREQLIARPEQPIAVSAAQGFRNLVERRRQGEPLAYLLGQKEFYGRMFSVSPAVLIPRPETELLVDAALRLAPRREAGILDLGTGSGCIGITLALERPQWRITATDVSPAAIALARVNADRLRATNIAFGEGCWFSAAPNARFDLIVSNPPYVAAGDPHLDALRFEPVPALVADGDGFSCLQTIIEGAPTHLMPGGHLALEHGHDQGEAVRALLTARGWRDVQTETDLAGLSRVTSARYSLHSPKFNTSDTP